MIRIAITQAAFDAIAATLPLGSVGYERAPDATGKRTMCSTTGSTSLQRPDEIALAKFSQYGRELSMS